MKTRMRQSIVPSLITPPTSPGRMTLLFVLSGYSVAAVLGLFALLGTPFVLALPGIDPIAILRVTFAQVSVSAAVLLLQAFLAVRRMRPLYLTLMQGPRVLPASGPPDQAAVRAAFLWPERVMWINTACMQLVPAVDALGLLPVSGLSGWSRLSVDLLSVAVAGA